MKEKIRIGCGAGFSGDRFEPALILTEQGNLDYLVLECLAERTIALAQKRKLQDPNLGYDIFLERRIDKLLPLLVHHKTRLITNMGAANPIAGAEKIKAIAKKLGLAIRVAVVLGDDVFDQLTGEEISLEGGKSLNSYGTLISANAYMGVDAILPAIASGADIILTGRVADPSLFLAPMVYEFGWDTNNLHLLGKGTAIGHLMECAGQLTGGYFADPVTKPVPDLHLLGHPLVEVSPDGTGIIQKISGTGGLISIQIAKEQLFYEVGDPSNYITPDVVADFSTVRFEAVGTNQLKVEGGRGKSRPDCLKVSVGYLAGWMGEGEISYAGAHAVERAKWAGEIIQKRIGNQFEEFRIDLIGINSMHGGDLALKFSPYEVRLRIVGKSSSKEIAQRVGEEVEALYTNGPAGGGGARKYVHEVIGVVSILMNRTKIQPTLKLVNS